MRILTLFFCENFTYVEKRWKKSSYVEKRFISFKNLLVIFEIMHSFFTIVY